MWNTHGGSTTPEALLCNRTTGGPKRQVCIPCYRLSSRLCKPAAPSGNAPASSVSCGVPSPSTQRTVKECSPSANGHSYRLTTQVRSESASLISAGCQGPSSTCLLYTSDAADE